MKLAIVGTHPDTRSDAPYDDPDFEIWAFNEAPGLLVEDANGVAKPWLKRVNAIFQMHTPTVYKSKHNRSDPYHWQWLQQEHGDLKIYMQEADPLVPNSTKYPLDVICRKLLGNFRYSKHQLEAMYFTSSVAYAIALAAYKSYRYVEVHIYGVEMAADTEYLMQRDCITFWIGILIGMGITVKMHCGGAIFNRPLYGYDSDIFQYPETFEKRRHEYKKGLQEIRAKENAAERGFIQACDDQGDFLTRLSEWLDASMELGNLEGIIAENDRYLYKVKSMLETEQHAMIDRHEFEFNSAAAGNEAEKAMHKIHRTAGRLDYVYLAWQQLRSPVAVEQIKAFAKEHVQAGYEHGKNKGVSVYNGQRLHELDAIIKAAGGEKAVSALVGEPRPELFSTVGS